MNARANIARVAPSVVGEAETRLSQYDWRARYRKT
jgi:hypothetical protein